MMAKVFTKYHKQLVVSIPRLSAPSTILLSTWQNKCNGNILLWGGRHSSVVSSTPTILWPQVRIPSTPSMLFSICIEIVMRK